MGENKAAPSGCDRDRHISGLPCYIWGFQLPEFRKNTPKVVLYLGEVLPYAIMGMLVVYCVKDVNIAAAPHGIPELIAGGVVVGLHIWKENTLLSIVTGTIVYMLLIQFVF